MRTKDVYQWIAREAKKLPEEGYVALHKKVEKEGVGVIPEMHKANHARRLKQIWKTTKSFEELNRYFNKFGLELNYKP